MWKTTPASPVRLAPRSMPSSTTGIVTPYGSGMSTALATKPPNMHVGSAAGTAARDMLTLVGCWEKGVVAAQPEDDALLDRDRLWEWLRDPLLEGLDDRLDDRVWDRLRDALSVWLCDRLCEKLSEGLADTLRDRLRERLRDALRDALWDALSVWLCDRLREKLPEGLADTLRDRLRDPVEPADGDDDCDADACSSGALHSVNSYAIWPSRKMTSNSDTGKDSIVAICSYTRPCMCIPLWPNLPSSPL